MSKNKIVALLNWREKMFRSYSLILIMVLGVFFNGCTTLEYLDGSSEEDVKQFKLSKSEMQDELQRLEVENEKLQSQIESTKELNQQLRDENEKKLAHVSEQNRSLNQEVDRLKQDHQKISTENEMLKNKLGGSQAKTKTSAAAPPKVKKGIRGLKIKVLYGDADPKSAEKMAKRLKDMGHDIQAIDQAPRSNFDITTIYFAPNSKYEAKRLMSDLGDKFLLKPLSWPSTFDLIVVTGSSN